MVENKVEIRVFTLEDSSIVKDLMDKYWGGEPLVVHHKNYYPSEMSGLLAFKNQHIIGFLF